MLTLEQSLYSTAAFPDRVQMARQNQWVIDFQPRSLTPVYWSTDLHPSTRSPTRGFEAELLGVFGVEALPAGELERLSANNASNGGLAEEVIEHIEANMPARRTH